MYFSLSWYSCSHRSTDEDSNCIFSWIKWSLEFNLFYYAVCLWLKLIFTQLVTNDNTPFQLIDDFFFISATTGRYIYIYSSSRSDAGDIAEVESGPIIATDHQCLSFWYFTTNSIDSVQIFQNQELLLDLTKKYEYIYNKWNYIYLPLKMISHNPFKLVFNVTRGLVDDDDDLSSSIAIDDILIENSCNSK